MIFNPSHLDSKEYSYPKTSGVQFAMVVPSTLRAIAFAYFASLCNATPADPTITSPPLLSKRYAASTCAGTRYREIYESSSSYYYGGCESSSYYSVFTECYGGVAYGTYSYSSGTYTYSAATSSTCTGYSSCIADTIKYAPDGYGSSFFIKCADSTPRMLYRTNTGALPILQSVTLSGSSSSLSSPSRITVTQTPSFSSTPTSNPTPSHRRKSIAGPIAGGVIGGIAVLSLVAFLIWFVIKKRQICKSAANDPSAYAQSQPVMVQQQPGYPPGPGPITMPEKAAMPPTSPASPYSQQEAWTPAMGGNPGISPSTSPPPTYFHQPQPMYPQQQSQQVSYQ
ncbi:hypothetical protein BKA61DRAFT_574812 [Leptodontidium sp. MPI-SDFR-AT-0119]|nr:hypothetical protein BKA61DRAFT_574812 [Leptodontidium sp. MPI-SDFR-AT-0119]